MTCEKYTFILLKKKNCKLTFGSHYNISNGDNTNSIFKQSLLAKAKWNKVFMETVWLNKCKIVVPIKQVEKNQTKFKNKE